MRVGLVLPQGYFNEFDGWAPGRAWDRIVERYAPIVVGRTGWDAVPDSPTFPEVSSTAIRARIAAGESVDHLVPPAVRRAWEG